MTEHRAAAPDAATLPPLPEPLAKVVVHTYGKMEAHPPNALPYLDTALSCDYVFTASQMHAYALAAVAALSVEPAPPDADALFDAWNNAPSTKGWNDLDEWDKVEAAFRAGVCAAIKGEAKP